MPIVHLMGRRTSTSVRKVEHVCDVSGRELTKGDTVATLSGDMTGRVCDLAVDAGAPFVLLRASHQPYGPGVWHPADQVTRVAVGRVRKRAETRLGTSAQPHRKPLPSKK